MSRGANCHRYPNTGDNRACRTGHCSSEIDLFPLPMCYDATTIDNVQYSQNNVS
jgi:hypothetical protein